MRLNGLMVPQWFDGNHKKDGASQASLSVAPIKMERIIGNPISNNPIFEGEIYVYLI